jgi:hypothetical protein
MYVFFSLEGLAGIFLVLRIERDIIKNDLCLHLKYQIFFPDINKTWIFDVFSKRLQISNFIKISPVEAELFHSGVETDGKDGHTDMTKVIFAFHRFANAHKSA